MGLFDDIFYDMASTLVETFVEQPTLFYVYDTSSRPLARPGEEVSEYQVFREVEIFTSPPFRHRNEQEKGGVSRSDLTNTRQDMVRVIVPSKNIPEDLVLAPSQHKRIELDFEGRRLSLKDYELLRADDEIARILYFGA